MKSIDKLKIFQLFTDTVEDLQEEDNVIENDIKNHPYIKIGTVVKGVENFYILDDMMRFQYKEKYEDVREAVKGYYFTRIYERLEGFDETDPDQILECQSHDLSSLDYAFSHMIRYFEKVEEYEKCARILRIQQAFALV